MLILKNIKNFYTVLCLSFLVISLALSNEKISANDKNKWELLEIKNVDEIPWDDRFRMGKTGSTNGKLLFFNPNGGALL